MFSLPSTVALKPDYRPDIDGLRAISIIAIVLYHLDVPLFPGGFVGVDIFFVISGYLITRLLVLEFAAGTFSYGNFLERRLRRIYPALALLVAAVCLLGYTLVIFPADRIQLGNSLMAQAVLSSELFFMWVNSYFDTALQQNLLLHTWTLGVELKFYLLFPLLWLTYKLQQRWQTIAIITTTAIISFSASVYLTNIAPSASDFTFTTPSLAAEAQNFTVAYFFIASRLWEFLVGALVFVCSAKITSAALREGLAFLGLALIGYSVTQFDGTTAFPGFSALVPVLGTACLIIANAQARTRVGDMLTLPPLVAIGVISYGIYLWHWPLIQIATLLQGELTLAVTLLVLALTTALAIGSYHFIETPVRTRRLLSSSAAFWVFVFTTLTATLFVGAVIKSSLPTDARLWDRSESRLMEQHNCGRAVCYFGDQTNAERTIFLWGDSQAMSIAPLIDALAQKSNTRVIAMIYGSCPPLYGFGYNIFMVPKRVNCEQVTAAVRQMLATEQINVAIISARWPAYDVWNDGIDEHVYMESTEDSDSGAAASAAAFDAGTKHTIETLLALGIEVYALGNIPTGTDFDIRQEFYDHYYKRLTLNQIHTDRASFEVEVAKNPLALTDTYSTSTFTLLQTDDIFCDDKNCYSTKDGVLLYRDAAHLNYWGVLALEPLFEPIFR